MLQFQLTLILVNLHKIYTLKQMKLLLLKYSRAFSLLVFNYVRNIVLGHESHLIASEEDKTVIIGWFDNVLLCLKC